jgi:hypothetical protein
MLSAHLFEVICFSILIVESIWIITVEIRRYRKRKAELDSYANAIKFQPLKLRFVVSALSYGIIPSIPLLLLFWWYMVVQDMWIGLLGIPFLVLIGGMPSAYPYYTILIHEGKLKGPTLWGWRWRCLELNLEWLDKEKILKQNPGRKLGITIFYSSGGEKILSLGLDNSQINQILALASEASEVK